MCGDSCCKNSFCLSFPLFVKSRQYLVAKTYVQNINGQAHGVSVKGLGSHGVLIFFFLPRLWQDKTSFPIWTLYVILWGYPLHVLKEHVIANRQKY